MRGFQNLSGLVNMSGSSSVVEHHVANVEVAGPTPVSRSIFAVARTSDCLGL